ncbi:hypothetical protein KGF54_000280 [Candida jiufengensis]|uniref:uncharacterized protein n=1 Tax=Candida jiufengensis TaxID=497108 RepID=UPI0022244692|nr:uncharacterized protein KGF54_000280 [Candida jiufengensis]KAI5957352.1 hypothetical protein KGF54_000280 [Candida jiufengensis]
MINYIIDPLINDLPLKSNEVITSISSYERNIYIGTSKGTLFHYHLFEDATDYLLISQLSIGSKSIRNLTCLKETQKLSLVCNGFVETYMLPELSPFATTSKLQNIKSICLYEGGNSIITIAKDKLQILRLDGNQWNTIKEIDYNGAIKVTSPVNNLILLANNKTYATLDTTNDNLSPLFEYKSELDVQPHIIQFQTPPGDREHLLTISSDENTSIAMFINSAGDVTRGTLTWIDQGYPKSVAISWPYVFAIFRNSLVVSSLESLEKVLQMELVDSNTPRDLENQENISTNESNYNIGSADIVYEDKSVEELTGKSEKSLAKMVVYNENKVFLLHEENIIKTANKLFQESLETNEFEKVLALDDEQNYTHLLKTLATFLNEEDPFEFLVKKDSDGAFKINPNLTLKLLGEDAPYEVYPGLQEVIDQWDFKDGELEKKYLQTMEPNEMTKESRYLYYKILPSDTIKTFIDKDTWSNAEDDKLIIKELLEDPKKQILVSKIYKSSTTDVTSEYTEYLLKYIQFEIIDDAIQFLQKANLEEKEYSKLLLNVIRLDQKKGYDFIKKSKKYHEVNRRILNGLSDEMKGEDFSFLQIELLETSFYENEALKDELFELIMSTLKSIYNDDMSAKVKKVHEDYKVYNSLENDNWPKISWLSYLNLSQDASIKPFIELYLKSFELALASEKSTNIFQYHKIYKEQNIQELLNFGDYSTAEKLAKGKSIEFKYYPKLQQNTFEYDKTKLISIFEFYLSIYEKEKN